MARILEFTACSKIFISCILLNNPFLSILANFKPETLNHVCLLHHNTRSHLFFLGKMKLNSVKGAVVAVIFLRMPGSTIKMHFFDFFCKYTLYFARPRTFPNMAWVVEFELNLNDW